MNVDIHVDKWEPAPIVTKIINAYKVLQVNLLQELATFNCNSYSYTTSIFKKDRYQNETSAYQHKRFEFMCETLIQAFV